MNPALITIGGVTVCRRGLAFTWCGPAAIDGDGGRHVYKFGGGGLDYIANAHRDPKDPSSPWVGVVTGPDGNPVIGPDGYLVSTTAWSKPGGHADDPGSYLDAEIVPYVSAPPELLRLGVGAWDLCLVSYGDREVAAVIGDRGPHGKLGEISIAAAQAVGIPASPKNGGAARGVSYLVWPGTSRGWPLGVDVAGQVAGLRATLPPW